MFVCVCVCVYVCVCVQPCVSLRTLSGFCVQVWVCVFVFAEVMYTKRVQPGATHRPASADSTGITQTSHVFLGLSQPVVVHLPHTPPLATPISP